jgi:hypothetical protein
VATLKERVDKHDRQITAINTLLKQGIRLLYQFQAENRQGAMEMRKELKALAAAQRRTEKTLDAFIGSMRRGSNGHGKPS